MEKDKFECKNGIFYDYDCNTSTKTKIYYKLGRQTSEDLQRENIGIQNLQE